LAINQAKKVMPLKMCWGSCCGRYADTYKASELAVFKIIIEICYFLIRLIVRLIVINQEIYT